MKLSKETMQYFKAQGKRGGLKSNREATAQERSERAQRAAQARWAKQKSKMKEGLKGYVEARKNGTLTEWMNN